MLVSEHRRRFQRFQRFGGAISKTLHALAPAPSYPQRLRGTLTIPDPRPAHENSAIGQPQGEEVVATKMRNFNHVTPIIHRSAQLKVRPPPKKSVLHALVQGEAGGGQAEGTREEGNTSRPRTSQAQWQAEEGPPGDRSYRTFCSTVDSWLSRCGDSCSGKQQTKYARCVLARAHACTAANVAHAAAPRTYARHEP